MIEKRRLPAKLLPLLVTTVLRGIEQGQSFIFAIQNISDGHHVWVIRAQGCLLYPQRTLKEGPADVVTPLHQAHTPCPSLHQMLQLARLLSKSCSQAILNGPACCSSSHVRPDWLLLMSCVPF